MRTLSPRLQDDAYGAKREAYSQLPLRPEWLTLLCSPPFVTDSRASEAWSLLLPHLQGREFPRASALDIEKAWSRDYHRASLSRGLRLLVIQFSGILENWMRKAPLRFLKVARMLGSLAPERRNWAISQSQRHPFLQETGMDWPKENQGQFFLETWSPLPPPSRVVDAYARKLSEAEEGELRLSIENWMPLVQLEILRYYCGAKVANSL